MRYKFAVLFILLVVLLAACGGSGETADAPEEAPAIEGAAEIESSPPEEEAELVVEEVCQCFVEGDHEREVREC